MQVVEAGESDAASRWLLCCVVSLDMVLMLQELLSGDWVGSFRRPAQPCLQPAKPPRCCQPLPTLWCLFHNNYLIPHTPHTSHFTLHTPHTPRPVSPEATVRGTLPQGPVLAGSGSAHLYLEDLRWQSMLHSLAVFVSWPESPPHSPRLTIRASGPR